MATIIRSNMADILLAIQARIMSVLEFPEERVVLDTLEGAEDREIHFEAEQYVYVRAESYGNAPGFEGMGRIYAPQRWRVTCTLWTRSALDPPPGAGIFLTAASIGHLRLMNKLLDALLAYQPTDDGTEDGNWLVEQPMQSTSGTGPRKARTDGTWGRSSMAFEVVYGPDVNQAYQ